jgi:hypothetical protein
MPGNSSIWIAFVFVSDHSFTLDGAFVDDVKLIASPPGEIEVMKEDFETRFPNPSSLWMVFDNDGAENGEYYWGADDFNPYQGEHSAWCARSGANGLDPENNNYPNNCNSWMVHGPFSLRNAIAGTLEFSFWLRSELRQDWLSWLFSTDGMHFSGTSTSGNVGEWQNETINLAYTPLGNLIGTTSPVWIAFIFTSNS